MTSIQRSRSSPAPARALRNAVAHDAEADWYDDDAIPRRPPTPTAILSMPSRDAHRQDRLFTHSATEPVHSQDMEPFFSEPVKPTDINGAGPGSDHVPTSGRSANDDLHKSQWSSRDLSERLSALFSSHTLSDSGHSEAIENDERTSLAELARLVRLSKHQQRKRASLRIRLQRSIIATGLANRLTRCVDVAQKQLSDSFRASDKISFTQLYRAVADVRSSCEDWTKFATLEPVSSELAEEAGTGQPELTPFFETLSTSTRDAFVDLLMRLRNDPDFLASRLCAMSNKERASLLVSSNGPDAVESVLPQSRRQLGRTASTSTRQSVLARGQVEQLLAFERNNGLATLMHMPFGDLVDSGTLEDDRRISIWSTACARLVIHSHNDPSFGQDSTEPLLICVLNKWSATDRLLGASRLEWFLLKILQDGAFLLQRAEDQHGTRFNISEWTSNDQIAAEDFYKSAVEQLFELVDDDASSIITEGVLTLCRNTIKQLPHAQAVSIQRWFVYKWLFGTWLNGVIVNPESHGMMLDCHITEYGRQKILKQVAMRASALASGLLCNITEGTEYSESIQTHVTSILGRFAEQSETGFRSRLLPSRSINSLRETKARMSHLLVSPADLLTIVETLYPQQRPGSSQSSCFSPAANSGLDMPSQHLTIDAASIVSVENARHASSASEATNQATAHTMRSNGISTVDDSTDDVIAYRLHLAAHELRQISGPAAANGACHPCAERWTILHISEDGNVLSAQLPHEGDEDSDDGSSTSSSEDEETAHDQSNHFDTDYHELRDTILHLVEDYEVPEAVGLDKPPRPSDRTKQSRRQRTKRTQNSPIIAVFSDAMHSSQAPNESNRVDSITNDSHETALEARPKVPVLVEMLEAASSQARAASDFVSAHRYWRTLQQLQNKTMATLSDKGFTPLISILGHGPRDAIRRSATALEAYEGWLAWLQQSQARLDDVLKGKMRALAGLRDKTWFVSDVRNSAPYEQSRNIVMALRTMAQEQRSRQQRQPHGRASGPNPMHRPETQIMELISATSERGGPNKLSDDQCEKTSRWLRDRGIENICRGEERLHRFCCEVETCVEKLTGQSVLESPVLWSSDLFAHDKKNFGESSLSRRGSHSSYTIADDGSSIYSDGRRYGAIRTSPVARDARGLQDPFRVPASRASSIFGDFGDASESYGMASPTRTNDSISTYWSPFNSTSSAVSTASWLHTPTTSASYHLSQLGSAQTGQFYPQLSPRRPGTAGSSSETLLLQDVNSSKTRFLSALKRSLTGLLLSDFGPLIFTSGAETDAWFVDLAPDCIARRDAALRKDEHYASTVGIKPGERHLNKRKAFTNLHDLHVNGNEQDEELDRDAKTVHHDFSKAAAQSSLHWQTKQSEFPFAGAYQRLLGMFGMHPNPFAKLDALFELRNLIISSTGGKLSPRRSVRKHVPGGTQRPTTPTQTSASHGNVIGRLAGRQKGSDLVHSVLSNLFRNSNMRPAALFRDLQYIASFVPASVLDNSPRGKAFWDAGFAALQLKQEVCTTLVEMADNIVGVATKTRRPSPVSANASDGTQTCAPTAGGLSDLGSPPTPPPVTTAYRLEDAGHMLTITAKEGDPTAQRELALFYLSNPELVERVVLPLSRPREVFKQEIMDKWGGSGNSRHGLGQGGNSANAAGRSGSHANNNSVGGPGKGDPRPDPALMCVAVHWFEEAVKGGDETAKAFLGQNEFLGYS